jgi:hypothetical protein
LPIETCSRLLNMTSRRRWWFRLITLAIVGSCALGTLELALRVLDPGGISFQVRSSSFLLLGLVPGGHPLVYRQGRPYGVASGYRLNQWGFRGRDWPLERSPGMRRIACVGDSMTFGPSCPDPALWTTRLAEALREQGRPSEVLNISVPGFNAVGMLGLTLHRALPFDPDLVLVLVVRNDDEIQPGNRELYQLFPSRGAAALHSAARPQTYPRDSWLYPPWWLANQLLPFSANALYLQAIAAVRRAPASPSPVAMGADARQQLPLTLEGGAPVGLLDMYHAHEILLATCRTRGVAVVLVFLGSEDDTWPGLGYLRLAAARHDVPLRFLPQTFALGERYRNSRVDGHYNAAGHAELARELLAVAGDLLVGQ